MVLENEKKTVNFIIKKYITLSLRVKQKSDYEQAERGNFLMINSNTKLQ